MQAELKAKQQAEMEADARYRAEIEERARAAAAQRQRREAEGAFVVAGPAQAARKRVNWPKAAAIGGVAIAAAAIGLLHVVPLSPFIPAAQELASERLGQPVQISGMRYALFPSPQLTLERVTIGRLQEIKADSVTVRIGPISLLGEQKDIESIEAVSVSAEEHALAGTLSWVRPQSGPQRLASIEGKTARHQAGHQEHRSAAVQRRHHARAQRCAAARFPQRRQGADRTHAQGAVARNQS